MASQSGLSRASSHQDNGLDRVKYQSPPPPASSMTPPPSTQVPQLSSSNVRTPTPVHSHLSSPPPTVKAAPSSNMLDLAAMSVSAEQVATASPDELRALVHELISVYRDAKTSAAHHKLQYQLLCMERDETINRMAVELDIMQREVEFLQSKPNRRGPSDFSPQSASQPAAPVAEDLGKELKNLNRTLELENENLRLRLEKSKAMILQLGNEVVSKMEDNDRLRKRIRDNRNHVNLLRRSGETGEGNSFSAFGSPTESRSNNYDYHSARITSTPKTGNDAPFAQLLLADQVLSQEAASGPSTPTARGTRKSGNGHIRGSQSMSSIPATPQQDRTFASSRKYQMQDLTPRMPISPTQNNAPNHQRRFSRDSTISASDLEGDGNFSNDEIPESQASQEATSMLRKSATRKADNGGVSSSARSNHMVQSKLHGAIKKQAITGREVLGKRKSMVDDMIYDVTTKKGRMSEGVGLGIHSGWHSPGK